MFLKQAFSDFIKIRHLRAPELLKRIIFGVVSLLLQHFLFLINLCRLKS